MGCAQSAGPCMNSPPSQLEKMKLQNGFEARRTTGLRTSRPDSADLKRNGNKNGAAKESVVRESDGGELAEGWPKWLTDNIPREVLKDLVPKCSDSYIKIDKIKCDEAGQNMSTSSGRDPSAEIEFGTDDELRDVPELKSQSAQRKINPELQLRGPVTRLRAKRLGQYLQGTVRRQLELRELNGSPTPQEVTLPTSCETSCEDHANT